uniref:Uncharacterized protein n=1 Tax=Alexandrium catenella TaxID=2925 RepID=A0A7S1SFW1_ALECA
MVAGRYSPAVAQPLATPSAAQPLASPRDAARLQRKPPAQGAAKLAADGSPARPAVAGAALGAIASLAAALRGRRRQGRAARRYTLSDMETKATVEADRTQRCFGWLPSFRTKEEESDLASLALLEKAFKQKAAERRPTKSTVSEVPVVMEESAPAVDMRDLLTEEPLAAEEGAQPEAATLAPPENERMDYETVWDLLQKQDAALNEVVDFAVDLQASQQQLKEELELTQELCATRLQIASLLESRQRAATASE